MINYPVVSAESDYFGDNEMLSTMIEACLEAKGRNVAILDMRHVSDIADYFVVVSGRSDRQSQGISNRIYDKLLDIGQKPTSVEGLDKGQWVVLDYTSVIVHVFYENARDLYDIEGFWNKAPKVLIEESIDTPLDLQALA